MIKRKRDLRRKLKWGVAGLGKFSEMTFIPALLQVRKAKLESLYSHSKIRAKGLADKYNAAGFYDDFDEFLRSDIEAVYIGSANHDHHMQVIKAARAGKHILCEKPLSITSDQAREMVEECRKNQVFLAVNYVFRFHPLVRKARELIKNHTIGKFIAIDAHFNINLVPGDNFRYSKSKAGGGALRDLGTHMLDLFRFLKGEIEEIDGVLDNVIYKTEVEDFAHGTVKFKKGGYGYFNVSYNAPKGFNRVNIIGSKGSLSIENMIAARNMSSKLTVLLEGEAKKAFRKRANRMLRLLKSVNRSFIRGEEPDVTGEDGLISMELMEKLEHK